ncbi:MAG: murein transglycosylase A, partial [Magnetococcales bacterium]|nr:murein transglycosylase A [Magnetococcales bacterium]
PWQELRTALAADKGLQQWAIALDNSASYYEKIKPDTTFTFPNGSVTAPVMARGCRELAALARSQTPEGLIQAVSSRFTLYRSTGTQGKLLVTGYYEPLLQGSEKPSKRYRYPIYSRPADLAEGSDGNGKKIYGRKQGNKILPYFSRHEIDEEKKLSKKGLELVWVDNRLDAFFLHVQGSGRVALPDGRTIRVGYDAPNGHPYKSIGSILVKEGQIPLEEISMQTIRKWLVAHPKEQNRLLYANPSYVFFKLQQGGPFGNINVPLTAFRSIATDHRIFPKGVPGILTTELPRFQGKELQGWDKRTFWVVNQDTGGAITGAGHVDLFTGFGELAEETAGLMKQSGTLYLLAPLPPNPS